MAQSTAMFCSNCGRPVLGSEPCVCGETAAAASADLMATIRPLSAHLLLVWQRLRTVLLMESRTVEVPLPAALLSMALRALVVAFLVDRWLRTLVSALLSSSMGKIPLIGSNIAGAVSGRVHFSLFWWTLLALVAASLANTLILRASMKQQFAAGVAALADAQWPVVIGVLLLWFTTVAIPLGVAFVAASLAWGQAILAGGLGRVHLAYRERMVLQAIIGCVTVLIVAMIMPVGFGLALKAALEGIL